MFFGSVHRLSTMKEANVNRAIIFASLVGILVSTYAMYVELVADLKPGYKALCDISEHASCSKVLTSKWVFKYPSDLYNIKLLTKCFQYLTQNVCT